jgi:hypothetical protein
MNASRTSKSRVMAVASPQHIGRFYYSEYWGQWDEVLDCGVKDGTSWWTVRGVGAQEIRHHSTATPEDCFSAQPRVDSLGRHWPPTKPVANASSGGAEGCCQATGRSLMGLHALVRNATFQATSPTRVAFKAHLIKVARALQVIAHAESGEAQPDAEAAAILKCLGDEAWPFIVDRG